MLLLYYQIFRPQSGTSRKSVNCEKSLKWRPMSHTNVWTRLNKKQDGGLAGHVVMSRGHHISLALAHSGHRMSSGPSAMKPLPTKEPLQLAQRKQSLCQCRSSKEMNLVPPIPVMGFAQAVHFFANSSPKHSAQYGFSSLEVNL